MRSSLFLASGFALVLLGVSEPSFAQADYRLLAANRTSTIESEMNQAASNGFRLDQVMGGETAFGGDETVVIMSRPGAPSTSPRFEYRLLATSRTSTMQEELSAAGREGFAYVGQTVFDTAFGGREVVVILERPRDTGVTPYEYRLLATRRTSTMEGELNDAGRDGFALQGLTVGETRFGGREVVAILSRIVP
jgi:hypothetical protein